MRQCYLTKLSSVTVVFHQKRIFNFWNSWINELAKNDREPVGRRRSGASRKSWTLWVQRVKMTDEGPSKADEWLTKVRAVNFSGNIDKHVGVTILLILFPLLIFLLNSLLYGEVINVGNLKKKSGATSTFYSLPWRENPTHPPERYSCQPSQVCAPHVREGPRPPVSKSLSLSLFVFAHGKWVLAGQRFADCWKGHNDDELTLCNLLLSLKHYFQLLM